MILIGALCIALFNTQKGYSILKRAIPDSLEQRFFYEFNSFSKELNFFQIFRRLSIDENEYIDIYLSNDDFDHIEKKKAEFLDVTFIKDEINEWREAEIRIKNQKYNMSYKFQGTSVSSLDRYSAMSYKIKLKKNNPFLDNFRRINLINYLEEATIATIASNSYSIEFDLLSVQSKLVPLRINSVLQSEPYIFHEDFRDEWLERDHQVNNYIVLKPNDDWDRKELGHQSMFDLYIQDYEYYGNNSKPEVAYGSLDLLLKSVRDQDVDSLKSFLDVDYFARFVAYSYLINNSHPIYGDNLRFVYDYTCGCFRIIFRLEDRINPITQSVELFNQSWFLSNEAYKGGHTFEIFKLLLTDKEFLKKRDQYLNELLSREEAIINHFNNEFDKNFKIIKAFHFAAEELNDFSTNLLNLKNNFVAIRNYLNYGKIFSTYDIDQRNLSIICDSYHDIVIAKIFGESFVEDINFQCNPTFDENLNIIPKVHNINLSHLPEGFIPSQSRPFFYAYNKEFDKEIKEGQTYLKFLSNNHKNFFLDLESTYKNIDINHQRKQIIFKSGTYKFEQNIVFPEGYEAVVQPGTNFFLTEGVSILFQGSFSAIGTRKNPITVKRFGIKNFGTFAISAINDKDSSVALSYFNIEGGSEAFIKGIQFLGQLSIYHVTNVKLDNITVSRSISDDGLNVKNAYVEITNSSFEGNNFDQVDLDYCEGFVRQSNFVNNLDLSLVGGDGLDLSGSNLEVSNNLFSNFRDKGISIGEKTNVKIKNNLIKNNASGIAVKDGSAAYIYKNDFIKNEVDITSYTKKKFYIAPSLHLSKDNLNLNIILANNSKMYDIDPT